MVASGFLGMKTGDDVVGEEDDLEMLIRYADPREVDGLKGGDVASAAALFDLSSGVLPGLGFLEGIYRSRIKGWVEYLAVDDGLIVKGGGVERLNQEEVRIAVEERGGVGVGIGLGDKKEAAAEKEWLKRWVERRIKDEVI